MKAFAAEPVHHVSREEFEGTLASAARAGLRLERRIAVFAFLEAFTQAGALASVSLRVDLLPGAALVDLDLDGRAASPPGP